MAIALQRPRPTVSCTACHLVGGPCDSTTLLTTCQHTVPVFKPSVSHRQAALYIITIYTHTCVCIYGTWTGFPHTRERFPIAYRIADFLYVAPMSSHRVVLSTGHYADMEAQLCLSVSWLKARRGGSANYSGNHVHQSL